MIVEFKYGKDHGNKKKGESVPMHVSTAKALVAHKIGKIVEGSEVVVPPKKKTKPGPIKTK